MSYWMQYAPGSAAEDFRTVPATAELRARIAAAATSAAERLGEQRPAEPATLAAAAQQLLHELNAPAACRGYAILSLSNSCWRDAFAAVPYARRVLFLPHCLRSSRECRGSYEGGYLRCARCGTCCLGGVSALAESLGYRVIVAEGTPGVLQLLADGGYDAVLGVACMESLEQAYARVARVGVPYLGVPLIRCGCVDTAVDTEELSRAVALRGDAAAGTPSYLPLLRYANSLFGESRLQALLGRHRRCGPAAVAEGQPEALAEDAALEWLREGGKRLRPFITLAGFACGRHGRTALEPEAELEGLIPEAAARVALAMEALHKASLVHDDIEDADDYRYGRETLHRRHGVPAAINAGDHLVGLGYALVAAQAEAVGARCAADILERLGAAHVALCLGQGAELFWREGRKVRPLEALSIYARKTAPAFDASLYAGLRLASPAVDGEMVAAFARYVGVAFQIENDLAAWERGSRRGGKIPSDLAADRPTLARAFAEESAFAQDCAALSQRLRRELGEGADTEKTLAELSGLYQISGALDRCRELAGKYRLRALALAEEFGGETAGLLRTIADLTLGA